MGSLSEVIHFFCNKTSSTARILSSIGEIRVTSLSLILCGSADSAQRMAHEVNWVIRLTLAPPVPITAPPQLCGTETRIELISSVIYL